MMHSMDAKICAVSRFGKHLPGRQAAQFSTLVEPKFSPMVPAGQAAQVSMFLAPCAMDLFFSGKVEEIGEQLGKRHEIAPDI